MPRFYDSDDDFPDDEFAGDDLDSDDGEFDNSEFDDEEEPTIECPQCGFEMLEIAYQCPRCGEIPSREFRQTTSQPRWVILTALLCLGLLLWWFLV